MRVFVISQKAALNSEKGYCPLWTEHRYKNSERNDDSLFSSRNTVRHLLFNKQIIPYHGNICRSPMAEFILKDMVRKRGIADDFCIASSATSPEEFGNPLALALIEHFWLVKKQG